MPGIKPKSGQGLRSQGAQPHGFARQLLAVLTHRVEHALESLSPMRYRPGRGLGAADPVSRFNYFRPIAFLIVVNHLPSPAGLHHPRPSPGVIGSNLMRRRPCMPYCPPP